MITAVLLCALAQIQSTFSLDPVPPCPTCDILMARVASLEARLAAVTGQFEAPRRVRLVELTSAQAPAPAAAVPQPSAAAPAAASSCYSTQAASPSAYVLPTVESTPLVYSVLEYPVREYSAPSVYSPRPARTVSFERPGVFGIGRQRFVASPSSLSFERRGLFTTQRFSTTTMTCGPGGCPP